jgi:hypothetical protein
MADPKNNNNISEKSAAPGIDKQALDYRARFTIE